MNKGFTPTPKSSNRVFKKISLFRKQKFTFFGVSLQGKRGFTLVETLVAILLLALAITGPMTIASRSIQSTAYARDQITATFLAQDILEFIIAKKNFNIENKQNWLTGMEEGTYCVDTLGGLAGSLSSGNMDSSCARLGISPEGWYRPNSGELTKFKRVVEIEVGSIEGRQDEVIITAKVSFPAGILAGDKEITLSTVIFNLNKWKMYTSN